jgi:hypothetical protein
MDNDSANKDTELYVVQAIRDGNPERHQYLVGVFDNLSEAISVAKREEDDRAGKYSCHIRTVKLNKVVFY